MKKVRLPILSNPYKEIYKILDDGKMEGCLGSDCQQSCCGKKKIQDDDGEWHEYRTTFLDDDEAAYQKGLKPKLREFGVRVTRIKVQEAIVYLIDGCLEEREGCRLEEMGRKPTTCTTFPLGIPVGSDPLSKKVCPEYERILDGNEALKARIAEVDNIFTTRRKAALREAYEKARRQGHSSEESVIITQLWAKKNKR